jgi:hypothetical protein
MLQALFAKAEQDLPGDDFTSEVMSQIGRQATRATTFRFVFVLLGLCATALLIASLFDATVLVSQWIATPLIALDNSLLAELFFPLNSFAALSSLVFLTMWLIYRRVFS